MKFSQLILEGGNLGASYGAVKIKKEHIEPTTFNFFSEFKKISKIDISNSKYLGSVGKKDFSNDIDLAVDQSKANRIFKWLLSLMLKNNIGFYNRIRNYKNDDERKLKAVLNFVKSKNSPFQNSNILCIGSSIGKFSMLNFVANQYDNHKKLNKKIQIDLNFGKIKWLDFVYNAELEKNEGKEIKGMHRTQLIKSILNVIYGEETFKGQFGVIINNEIINDRKKVISLISQGLNIKVKEEDLKNYTSITNILRRVNDKKLVSKIFDYFINIILSEKPKVLESIYIPTKKDFDL